MFVISNGSIKTAGIRLGYTTQGTNPSDTKNRCFLCLLQDEGEIYTQLVTPSPILHTNVRRGVHGVHRWVCSSLLGCTSQELINLLTKGIFFQETQLIN